MSEFLTYPLHLLRRRVHPTKLFIMLYSYECFIMYCQAGVNQVAAGDGFVLPDPNPNLPIAIGAPPVIMNPAPLIHEQVGLVIC